MKLQNISNYVLYAICALSALVFLMFFVWGYADEMIGDKVAPKWTSLLLFWQYALGFVTFVMMGWSLWVSVKSSGGSDEKSTTGVPGKMIVIVTSIITALSWGIGFALNLGEEAVVKNNDVLATSTMVTVTDAFMFTIYVLAIVSIIAVVVSATGVMTKSATKR